MKSHNNREWFVKNKERYESTVRDPALKFIATISKPLHSISSHVEADPRPMGGSLFRIYRDIRFSKDKTPYRTHVGIHLTHDQCSEEIQGPGYYIHIEPGKILAGGGIWHPDSKSLGKIRDAIVKHPKEWSAIAGKMEIEGDSLTRPPQGYDPNHPLITDLKRKDFFTSATLRESQVTSPKFMEECLAHFRQITPLMKFLAQSLKLAW